MKKIGISAIEYYLPEKVIDNDFFEHAKNDFLEEKVGIKERHIATEDQSTSDLAVKAVNQLIEKNNINRNEIEFMVLCTLSPDYILPQTSAQVQTLCELPNSIYTVDVRMGCTGFVHSLSIAQSLIAGMGFKKVWWSPQISSLYILATEITLLIPCSATLLLRFL